jgi:hypothetical protein
VTTAFSAAAGQEAVTDDVKDCSPPSEITPLATETASAGYVSNVLKRAGSIRVASNRLLTSALDTARSKEPMQWVVFTSTPELSKKSDDDDLMCARHEQATEKDPLEFEDKHFASADELTDWLMDFTRGKGADGKSLYEQCPGKCSPRYTWWIEPVEAGMKVRSRVVCGLPRDHDGNKYHLTIALTPACSGDQKQGAEKSAQ